MAGRVAKIAVGLIVLNLASALALAVLGRMGIGYRPVPTAELTAVQQDAVARVVAGTTQYLAVDADLGWTIRPHGVSGLYHANAAGLRGSAEFAALQAPGVVRIAAFGDSFTHGDEVADGDTWEAQLAREQPGVEVLNFGVPGYGPDQAWLRYQREATAFHPDIVLLGLVADDLPRMVNTFVPFRDPDTGMPLAKPRFVVAGDGLSEIPCGLRDASAYQDLRDDPRSTLARQGAQDAYFQAGPRASAWDGLATVRLLRLALARPLDPSTETLTLLERLLQQWAKTAAGQGRHFAVLLLPQREELAKPESKVTDLRTWLGQSKIPILDGREAFPDSSDAGRWFGQTHYTPEANSRVARLVGERLLALGWLSRPVSPRSSQDQEER